MKVIKVATLGKGFDIVRKKEGEYTLFIKNQDGKLRKILPETTIYLNGKDYKAIDLFKLVFTGEEFYRAYYGITERTMRYLKEIKENIGLTAYYHKFNDMHEEVKKITHKSKLVEDKLLNKEIEVYETQDKRYVALYYRKYFDAISISSFVFNRYPDTESIKTALQIEYVETILPTVRDSSVCFECGKKRSFVEFAGDTLEEKMENYKRRVCEHCSSVKELAS